MQTTEQRLVCVECGTVTHDGCGWRALLTTGDEEAVDNDEVAVYCSECAAREFDEP